MKKIAVLGTGYVGVVTAAFYAQLGNTVVGIDVDEARIATLQAGGVPFFEPGLAELVGRGMKAGRLRFSNDPVDALRDREIVFIAVGTPTAADGSADLSQVRSAAECIGRCLDRDTIVVNKSTVPVETCDLVASIVARYAGSDRAVRVVSNPEFLREGTAVADFMRPDRIVLGTQDSHAEETMRALYAPLGAPFIVADARTAEMIKYAANAFLATKISFFNEIAAICEAVGADVCDVARGVGADSRIGTAFTSAGLGYGGSCLPKDVLALTRVAQSAGVEAHVLNAARAVNAGQIAVVLARLEEALGPLGGRHIGLLGLAFKPETDDVRESPAIALAQGLVARGASVAAHDPVAIAATRRAHGDFVHYVSSAYEAANDADALVIATDWAEYKQLDFGVVRKLLRAPYVFDARNIYDSASVAQHGLFYLGIGRAVAAPQVRLSVA